MARATIFLRQPAGVAIRTDSEIDYGKALLKYEILTVKSEKGVYVSIPIDNVASIEWTDA